MENVKSENFMFIYLCTYTRIYTQNFHISVHSLRKKVILLIPRENEYIQMHYITLM